jgi:hypothetical protein
MDEFKIYFHKKIMAYNLVSTADMTDMSVAA